MSKRNRRNRRSTKSNQSKINNDDKLKSLQQELVNLENQRSGGFFDASEMGRLRADWPVLGADFSSFDLEHITNRATQLYYNSGWIKSAVITLTNNILSSKGLRIRPIIKDYNDDPIYEYNEILKKEFDKFNDYADSNQQLTFYQLQNNWLASLIITGNIFIIKQPSPTGSPFNFSLRCFDTSHLDFTKDSIVEKSDNFIIENGIKYSKKNGEVISYLFKNGLEISKENCIHIYLPNFSTDLIGVSWLIHSLTTIWDIEQLMKSQVLSSRVRAGLALWFKSNSEHNFTQSTPLSIVTSEEPPEVIEGSSQVNSELIPLINMALVKIASSLGLSKSALTRDLQKESFSSGRLRSMADAEMFDFYTKFFSKQLSKVYSWFVQDCVAMGKLKGLSLSDYMKDKWRYDQVYFINRIRDYIDPVDHANALTIKRQNYLITDSEIWQDRGRDVEEVYKQLAYEKQLRIKYGLEENDIDNEIKSKEREENEKEDLDNE